MSRSTYAFHITDPALHGDDYYFSALGQAERRHGPCVTEQFALDATHELFQRWAHRARELGATPCG